VTAAAETSVIRHFVVGGRGFEPLILRTLVRHDRTEVAGALYPCAGAYAVVETPGTIRAGDRVSLA
jgi:hypothetical protein